MAVFRYRMQSILNLKVQMEEQARMEFATANAELVRQQEILKELTTSRSACLERGRELRGGSLNALDLKENTAEIKLLDDRIAAQMTEVQKAGKALDRARLKLQKAMQEKKMQERLREKAFEEFVKEENAKESKVIDELVTFRQGQKLKETTDG